MGEAARMKMDPQLPGSATVMSSGTRAVAILLLVLACLHCSRAIFFENVSWIDLKLYAAGQERSPFQQRVAMMPILHLAGESAVMQKLAALIDKEDRHQLGREAAVCAEPMSAEKLASMIAGTTLQPARGLPSVPVREAAGRAALAAASHLSCHSVRLLCSAI